MVRSFVLSALVLMGAVIPAPAFSGEAFTVLAYHDIQDEGSGESGVMTITTQTLIEHFSWLREHDYHVVSLDDIIASREGRRQLPEKAVLLTFDDGYVSVYTRVYPLLKLFKFPAVIALVGSWMEAAPGEKVSYGNESVPRERFLTWKQVGEMLDSGYVEVASHSYDLHRGVIANPQGNEEPAATAIVYLSRNGRYESGDEYKRRLVDDLSRNTEVIKRHTGKKPRAIIWPYGSLSRQTVEFARSLGMTITMGLEPGPNDSRDLSALHRIPIPNNSSLSDFVWTLRNPEKPRHIRVAQVDLDYVFDPDAGREEANLSLLLDRIKRLGINTVYLQAFADPKGEGTAGSLYFPNRHLPMRADLFNRVSWQLQKRAGVQVYAWMPVLSFKFSSDNPVSRRVIQRDPTIKPAADSGRHERLSPFHPEVRKMIGEIYEDLARYANISGILFDDDAYMTDQEDASPWALSYYATQWKLPNSVREIRKNPGTLNRWTSRKTQFLTDFTVELANRVKKIRPDIKTARNLYSEVVLNPEGEDWLSQSFASFLKSYDYLGVLAMPYLENAKDPDRWLRALVNRIEAVPGAMDKTVFELQSVDWRTRTPVGGESLARQIRLLETEGVPNIGYYPDDFIKGYPDVSVIAPQISLNADPYIR